MKSNKFVPVTATLVHKLLLPKDWSNETKEALIRDYWLHTKPDPEFIHGTELSLSILLELKHDVTRNVEFQYLHDVAFVKHLDTEPEVW